MLVGPPWLITICDGHTTALTLCPGDTGAAVLIVVVAARREDRDGAEQRAHAKAGAPEVAAALGAGLAGRLPGTKDS